MKKIYLAPLYDTLLGFTLEYPIIYITYMFSVKLFTLSQISIILTIVSIITNFVVAIVIYSLVYRPKITDKKLYITGGINSATAGISHILSDYSVIYLLRFLGFSFRTQITIAMIFVYIIDFILKVLGTYLKF